MGDFIVKERKKKRNMEDKRNGKEKEWSEGRQGGTEGGKNEGKE